MIVAASTAIPKVLSMCSLSWTIRFTLGVLMLGCFTTTAATQDNPANSGIAIIKKNEPKHLVVPADKIVLGSPGSRQLRALEPEFFIYRDTPEKIEKYSMPEGLKEIERVKKLAAEKSLVYAIERAMAKMPTGKTAQAGFSFAVEGRDRAALQGIYDVLVKGEEPQESFSSASDVSVVFHTLPIQPGVAVDQVERIDNNVRIRYSLIAHGLQIVDWKLAIIPLEKLPPGTYDVEMIRSVPSDRDQRGFPPVALGFERRAVCRPFSFVVTAQP